MYGNILQFIVIIYKGDQLCVVHFFIYILVVWAASTELGIARAYSNGKLYIVANYNPPGNFRGRFAENVLAPE